MSLTETPLTSFLHEPKIGSKNVEKLFLGSKNCFCQKFSYDTGKSTIFTGWKMSYT